MARKALPVLAGALLLAGPWAACHRPDPPAAAVPGASAAEGVPEAVSPAPEVPEVVAGSVGGRPVIFLGLDGADWALLDRYMAAGAMPQLAALVEEGQGGVLLSEHPPLSPLLWTTIVTGASPLDHGILDFTRFRPGSGLKEPITSDERRVPAIWNMASYGGKSVAVFGLWATYPAEAVRGLLVSDRLMGFLYQEATPPPGAVYPPAREPWAREILRQVEEEVDLEDLRQFLPWLAAGEYDRRARAENPYDHPVGALRRILVETRVYHRLASEYLAAEEVDLAVVYIQGSDSVGHVFAPFAPPRQESVSQGDFDRYRQVPELYFRYLDGLLGDYRRLAEDRGAVLMLASDHGFRWHQGRPTQLSSFAAATAARWHRKEGIYLLWGPGIPAAPGHPHSGGIRQVAATLLRLLGLPAGREVAGPALPGATAALSGTPAKSGETVGYRSFYQPPPAVTASLDDEAAAEELAKLRALGYIGADEAATAPAGRAGGSRTAGYYNNQALILQNEGDKSAAQAAFEQALELDPGLASALWNLSDMLFADGRELERSDRLLVRAFSGGLPEGLKYVIGRAIGYDRSGDTERGVRLLDRALQARADEPELWLFRGRYRMELGDCDGALADFEQSAALTPEKPESYASMAMATACLGDREGAVRWLERALEIEPNQPQIRQHLERLKVAR